ncbi:unnamed protein product [[Candida] boidinii]|nr:unnamed protein product [[Candida] boidinii]
MQTNPLSDDDSILVSDTDSEILKIRRHGATRFLKIVPQTLENNNNNKYSDSSDSDDFNNKTPTGSPIRTPICSPIKEYYDNSDNESENGQVQNRYGYVNCKNSPYPKPLKSCLSPTSSPIRNRSPVKIIPKDMDSEFSDSDSGNDKSKVLKLNKESDLKTVDNEDNEDNDEEEEEIDQDEKMMMKIKLLKVSNEEIDIAIFEEISKDSENVSSVNIYNNLCDKYRIKQIKDYNKSIQFEGFHKIKDEFSLVPKTIKPIKPIIRDGLRLNFKEYRHNDNFFKPTSKKLQKVRFNEIVRVRI